MTLTTEEIIQALGSSQEVLEFGTTPARAFILVSQLQLALRHPQNQGSGSQIAREIVEHLTKAIGSVIPEAEQMLRQGWDSTYDMDREQFEMTKGEPDLLNEVRIMNASNLLQEVARQTGKPMILGANQEMCQQEGIQIGNPEAADLEQIIGLTIAIPCNPFEAQFLINGINELIEMIRAIPPDEPHDTSRFPAMNQPPRPRRTNLMNTQELEVMAVHALSIIIATELLAEASNQATAEDWLTLIMAKARTRYEESEPGQLQAYLDHVLKAWRGEPIN